MYAESAPVPVAMLRDYRALQRHRDVSPYRRQAWTHGASHHIRVFLLDDHEIVRRGVKDMLEAEGDGDGVKVCREIRSQLPEVACLMPTSCRG